MNRAVLILLGLLALALLIFLCVRNHSTSIQTDIQERTTSRLESEPTTWAKVSTSGRDVLLSGIAPSEALRNKAEELALAVPGVFNVDNQIQLAKTDLSSTIEPDIRAEIEQEPITTPSHSPYKTKLSKTDSGIILSGFVPDEDSRHTLIKLAEDKFGIGNVNDQLEIGLAAPENWLQIATSAINNLNFLKIGDADMTDSHLKLTGQALDTAANTTIANNFNQLSTLFSVDLEIANPPIPVVNTSVTEQAPEHSCLDQFKQSLSNDRIIYFSTDSSQLKELSERAINKILQFSSACPNSIIEVAGYTDSRGSEPYNLTLSNKRAKSIANELIKRGVPTKMLTVKGYGESNPSSNNDTGKGQANNRRIEFRYLQEGE